MLVLMETPAPLPRGLWTPSLRQEEQHLPVRSCRLPPLLLGGRGGRGGVRRSRCPFLAPGLSLLQRPFPSRRAATARIARLSQAWRVPGWGGSGGEYPVGPFFPLPCPASALPLGRERGPPTPGSSRPPWRPLSSTSRTTGGHSRSR